MAKLTEKGEEDEMWKQNLEEWIYEESKIVTYKWLSKAISVHVNTAKQMLYYFLEKHNTNQKKQALEVIYLLAGRLAKSPKSMKVCLAKSEDLKDKEAMFESLTSKHIYAISLANPGLMDECNLCQVATCSTCLNIRWMGFSQFRFS